MLVDRDLDAIRADTLRVLVVQHQLIYERARAIETGLEFELLERVARELELPLKAIVVERPDSLLPMLRRGQGDVIAAQLTPKGPLGRWLIHTVPYRYVAPVFVTLRADHVLRQPAASPDGPDTAWVSAWSPFAPKSLRFPGADPEAVPQGRTVFTDTSRFGDNTAINVAIGRVQASIISEAAAVYFAQRFPQLAFSAAFDAPVPLVFGLRPNARQLQRALDKRLNDPKEKEAMAMLMSAYGHELPERDALGAVPCATDEAAVLPAYAHRPVRDGFNRDWELLAAIAFQGARADSAALLRSMDPEGAGDFDVEPDDPRFTAAQVRTVARYFIELDSLWARSVPDPQQRLRFIAAAYDVGPAHVQDACVLAERLQLDPARWEGHVERAITLLALPRFFSQPGLIGGPCAGDEAFIRTRETVCLYEHFHQTRR